jgi:hypothetical protein
MCGQRRGSNFIELRDEVPIFSDRPYKISWCFAFFKVFRRTIGSYQRELKS